MKVLIVSDTHKKNENFFTVLKRESPVDMVIHCGDAEGSEDIFREAVGGPFHIVAGNNDFFSELDRETEFKVGPYHVWLTHGHNYYVSMGSQVLKEEARSRNVDIVMYGHTHKPAVEREAGLIAVNPGSLTYPRQEGRRPSYIVMELCDHAEPVFSVRYV